MQTNKSNGALTAQINVDNHKKSGFDLSNNVLGTGKIGRIIPTRALHVMPNDTIKADSKVAVQFEPLAVPILANMDVKQEHFYVPYNIVWKNWDKFISGGEKMDYKGVVPNTTMQAIVQVAGDYLIGDELGFPLTIEENQVVIDLHAFDDMLRMIENNLISTGDDFQIKDLLKPQFEVINQMRDLCRIYEDQEGQNIQIFERSSVMDMGTYYGMKLGYKYFDQILPALIANDSNFFWKPNTTFFGLIELMYEFYKPIIGIGSNIDYLNMGRITFTDFLYILMQDLYNYREGHDMTGTWKYQLHTDYVSAVPMSILNLRANYNVWYNNYRDVLLEADAFEPVDIDNITQTELFVLLVPRQRCWEKDAFTTALDNPGTGNVGVPINNSVNVANGDYEFYAQRVPDETITKDGNNIYKVELDGESWYLPTAYLTGINSQNNSMTYGNQGFSLYALDAAQRAQKWLQKALYFGNRISDFYYLRFGVRFLDARLRLPELLTSSSELVKLDVVMNNTNITTEANGEIYQSIAGDRAAYASAYDNGNSFERYCEEHGVILSYLTIMPQVTYAYGMNRDYSRLDQFDFAFNEFATLGMDAVYDSEITSLPVDLPDSEYSNDIQVFGYQGKYYDYKAKHNEEHGELLDSQDMYTFARKFNMYDSNGRPKLNYEFVHCFPDLDMFVVNSTLSDYFRYDIRHSTAAERNLPSQSIYI